MTWLVLALGAPVLAAGAWLVWRRPLYALYAFLVGLAFHNAAFMGLWLAGAEGWQLTVLQAWKEILLGTALLSVVVHRQLPRRLWWLDWAVLALALVAVAYFFVPTEADLQGRLYGLRGIALPVAAYAVGRALVLTAREWRRLAAVALGTAVAVSVLGIAEHYGLTLDQWRAWGAKGYYSEQLDFPAFHGPAGLPDNWALNLSDGVFRRLISSFLSPLGTAYLLGIALLVAVVARPRLRAGLAAAVILAAFLLAFSRAAAIGFFGALVLLALVRRSWVPAVAGVAVLATSVGMAAVFPWVAPETRFFPEDRAYQERRAQEEGPLEEGSPLETTSGFSDASSRSHLSELRRSFENLLDEPLGRGLGTTGQIAQRFGEGELAAGESLYLTVGVETGFVGLAALLALAAATLGTLFVVARRFGPALLGLGAAVLLAAQAAVFAIGLQTEVWGIPWLVYGLWFLTGSVVAGARQQPLGAAVVVWRHGAEGREFLLLRRRYAPGPEWKWTPPSGARDGEEPVDECARRELLEETGLALPLLETSCNRGDWAIFAAEAPGGAEVRLDDEHEAFEWLALDDALARCRPPIVASGLACVAEWLDR
ncbi:MAG: NUDIX domain-containing protein [Gaiellaceae bacterium]